MDKRNADSFRLKRSHFSAALVLGVMIGLGALVSASVPHTFNPGDTLHAADVNGNFSALDKRLTTLESGPQILFVDGANLAGSSFCVQASGTFAVDCTCPTGTFVISGGGFTPINSGQFVRGSWPTSATSWRITCANAAVGGGDVLCQQYTISCTRPPSP
jgi:hypothetical protein